MLTELAGGGHERGKDGALLGTASERQPPVTLSWTTPLRRSGSEPVTALAVYLLAPRPYRYNRCSRMYAATSSGTR